MKTPARKLATEPILIDRNALAFGTWGKGGGAGMLILTEQAVVFDQSGSHLEIPVDSIDRLGVGLWHGLQTRGVPVLKITYAGNLVFGVAVAHPESWIRAIEQLTARSQRQPAVDRRYVPKSEVRRFRFVTGAFLVLVLVLTVALPLLFSWMSAKSAPSPPPAYEPTGTAG